ncbi:MAG: molybdopterin-dependent oxidoreductase [Candidatus Bipolaricaulis sp.]|nr:molybdopterin-dependent oxidoreductase [Candidatus Bipolaricaulis sp.]
MSLQMHRRLLYTILGLFAALVAASAAISASDDERGEITEYQGEKLGSIGSFREYSIRGVQVADPRTDRLVIDGPVTVPAACAHQELQSMPHTAKLVAIHCAEGSSVKAFWEGISLVDLLARVAPLAAANTVIFHAVDG